MPDPRLGRQIEAEKTRLTQSVNYSRPAICLNPCACRLGKSWAKGAVTGDVFDGITSDPIAFQAPHPPSSPALESVQVELGGFWGFYREFWRAHELNSLLSLRPEIAVQLNDTLTIPLLVKNNTSRPQQVTTELDVPPGWKQKSNSRAGHVTCS